MSEDEDQFHEIKKIAFGYRALCGFMLIVSIIGMAGVIGAIIFEDFHFIAVVALVVCFFMSHIAGTIVFTGYAPSYLLFAHGKVNLKDP